MRNVNGLKIQQVYPGLNSFILTMRNVNFEKYLKENWADKVLY